MLIKLSYLNSYFALSLDYLNLALNDPALEIRIAGSITASVCFTNRY